MARLVLPAAWGVLTGGERTFETGAATLGEALEQLLARHPGLRPRLLDTRGRVPSYVSLFVGEQSVKTLQGLETPLAPDAQVMIVPAVVGG